MALQIVVVDKLDYCASKRNLDECKDSPNFKASALLPTSCACRRHMLQPVPVRSASCTEEGVQLFGHGMPADACGTPPSQFVKADIQSADLISHVLQTEEIDTIMHFAAQVGRCGKQGIC